MPWGNPRDAFSRAGNLYDEAVTKQTPPQRQPGQPTMNAGGQKPPPESQPGHMEKYWEGLRGQMQNQSRPTNLAAEAYHRNFAGGGPAMNLDPYYERAQQRGSREIDRAMAARGMYGSGAAMEAQRDFTADLGAAQANREADYALKRIAEQRLGATGVDTGSRAASADQRGWALAGGTLAGAAQTAERQRQQDMLQNLMNQYYAGAGVVQPGYENLFGQDQNLIDQYYNLMLGGNREAANQTMAHINRFLGGAETGVNIGETVRGWFGGGDEE